MGCLPEQFSSEPFLFQIHAISITPKHYQLKEITEFGVSAGRAAECFCPEKVLTGRQGRRERQEAWLLHSFQRIRGLRGVEQLLWQIEALFDLSIHHLRCGFPDSSHTDHRAPRSLSVPLLLEQEHSGTSLLGDALGRVTPTDIENAGDDTSFKAPQLISTSFCRAQAKPLRCVVIDSPDARRHRSVAAHIPVAFFLIWIISVLVSEHHSSFPFLQAFTQHSEHTEGRARPINARNTKITWQVACIGWTFCRRNVQAQLLRFA